MNFLRATLMFAATATVILAGAVGSSVYAQAPPDTSATAVAVDTTSAPAEMNDGESDTLKVVLNEDQPVRHGVHMTKDPTWAALRSAVLPGWGQAYTDNWIKAIVFAGVDAGLVYGAYVQHDRYVSALDDSKNTKTDDERETLERSANFYRDDRNKLLWYVAGVMILSSLDAYVEAHLYDFHIDPILETPPNNDGVQAGIRITFSF